MSMGRTCARGGRLAGAARLAVAFFAGLALAMGLDPVPVVPLPLVVLAALFLAVVLRAAVVLAALFLAVVLRAAVFLAALFLAVVLRAAVFLAAGIFRLLS